MKLSNGRLQVLWISTGIQYTEKWRWNYIYNLMLKLYVEIELVDNLIIKTENVDLELTYLFLQTAIF